MKYIAYVFIILLVVSCKSSSDTQSEQSPIIADGTPEKIFAQLEAGEVFFKDENPFGSDVELTGENKIADTLIFKVVSTQALVKDGYLVMKNGYKGTPFTVFSIENMDLVAQTGRFGQGPGEFSFPYLVQSNRADILCYVYESTNSKLYTLGKGGELVEYSFDFGKSKMKYSDRRMFNIAPDDFIYVENTPKGKSIFRASKKEDSTVVREVFDLALNPKRKAWSAYMGDFIVNSQKNRMAYAYKYFKIIKFMDLEAGTVRTINFEKGEWDETTEYKVNGMDANVTHYWGAASTDDYVYFAYSGRTPVQVFDENRKGINYIFIEKYDWNGTPIARYRLDRWGYFTVDGKCEKLYLFSTEDDDPLFIYNLKTENK